MKWVAAVRKEMDSVKRKDTFKEVDVLPGMKEIPTKFIFKLKRHSNGTVFKYKARLDVKGFMKGDVPSTYAPVVVFSIVLIILAFALERGYCLHQMDVTKAVLHDDMDTDVYIKLPHESGIRVGMGKTWKLF